MSNRLMAQMLGLEVANVESSTSYYNGCQWFPRLASSPQTDLQDLHYSSTNFDSDLQALSTAGLNGIVTAQASEWSPQTPATPSDYGMNNVGYPATYDFGHYGV